MSKVKSEQTDIMSEEELEQTGKAVTISPPRIQTAEFLLIGTAPYVQKAFSQKARRSMKAKQIKGSRANKERQKEAKSFEEIFEQSKHISREGWCGVPASAFRAAMISACRLVGYKMTLAKLSIFVKPDGFDRLDGTPLVRIYGEPEYSEHVVRFQGTTDITARPMWREGWRIWLRVQYDEDQFTLQDVTNLLCRVGMQVGIGEGRPDSKTSCGMGWGTFRLAEETELKALKEAA